MPAKAAAKAAKKGKARPKKDNKGKVKRGSDKFTTLRKRCAPGTIAIMLAGRFRGKRAVILKQLPKNGPLIVTGPMKYNGVPLRRVNSRYIIATSTKVDISGVDTSKITPELFARAKVARTKKSEADYMGDKQKQKEEKRAKKTKKASTKKGPNGGKVSDARAAIQKSIDAAVIAAVKKDSKEKVGYLKSIFQIKAGDAPHRMRF